MNSVEPPEIPNPFGRFLDKVAFGLRRFPSLSTWCAALFLSFVWTVGWLGVFALSTWKLNLETSVKDFVNLFWLSIAAEAIIRWAENTNFVSKLAKPHVPNATGDNADFSWKRALSLFFTFLFMMFFLNDLMISLGMEKESLVFEGIGEQNGEEFFGAMLKRWYELFTDTAVVTLVILGTLARSMIYKRSSAPPKTSTPEKAGI